MKVPFLDLAAHHHNTRDEIMDAISEVAKTNSFAGGPLVHKFETEWAAYCGVDHAVGVANGTDSLYFILAALGIGPGDEVITVPMTFIATVEAISRTGAKPVFVDIDPRTYTMDPLKLEAAITDNTRAIIPVHLFGQCADMDPINAIAVGQSLARETVIHVIEDAAQAHGATYKGRKAGSLGIAGSFSFYPGKNLGAWGEAGAVTTNNSALAQKIRVLRDHGQSKKYHHEVIGWNGRMDGIQAAVLSVKLKYLDSSNRRRVVAAMQYENAALGTDVAKYFTRYRDAANLSVYHVLPVVVPNRDAVLAKMSEFGVSCGIHYPIPVHLQPCYASLGYKAGDFLVSEACAHSFLSLPIYPEIAEEQIAYVVSALRSCLL